jgi:hypothetical protein
VALRRDDSAASPLVVITTFVLVAVLLTIAVYALVFDKPTTQVQLVQARNADGSLAFIVSHASGGLSWPDLQLRLVDRDGTDLAPAYLHVPTGAVHRQDKVAVDPLPPAGTYVLLVLHKDAELSRLVVTV